MFLCRDACVSNRPTQIRTTVSKQLHDGDRRRCGFLAAISSFTLSRVASVSSNLLRQLCLG